MIDTSTQKPIRVANDEASGPYVRVTVDQVEQVRSLLVANNVPHWVEHLAISVDGRPAVVVINIGKKADPRRVQALLDGV